MKEVVLDIPHGGKEVPEEVKDYVHPDISRVDLLNEADLYSQGFFRQLEGIPAANKHFLEQFRAIIDVNRARDDFRRDGIVKRTTSTLKQLYKDPKGLPRDVANGVIQKYAEPYLSRLSRSVERPETKLVVLGHTMEPVGPQGGITPGVVRPLFNLANGGDLEGNSNAPYQATRDDMEFMRDEIEARLARLNLDGVRYNGQAVSFNYPFPGKKSIDRIGPERLSGKKAIMVEVNKSLVIDASVNAIREVRPENIATVRSIVHDVIDGLMSRITR